MANPNSNYSNVIYTTWEDRSKELADNLSNSNVILAELSRKGRVRPIDGGIKISEGLIHTGTTATWYTGAEQLSTGDADVINAAEYTIKELATNVTMTGLEKAENAGSSRHIDLLEGKMQAAEATMNNTLTSGIYSLGTESGGKTLVGLRAIIANDGTGTVGNIARASYSFWANQYSSGTTTSATNVQAQLSAMWAKCVRGGDQTDVITMGTTFWGFYMASLQALARFVDSKTAALGFAATQFMGANAYLDATVPTATNAYFINTKYLSLRPHRSYNMKALPPIASGNQPDTDVIFLCWKGALTASNCARQGVIVGA